MKYELNEIEAKVIDNMRIPVQIKIAESNARKAAQAAKVIADKQAKLDTMTKEAKEVFLAEENRIANLTPKQKQIESLTKQKIATEAILAKLVEV